MVGWLIYNEQDAEKNKRYIEFYMEEGKLQNIEINLILVEKLEFGIHANQWFLTYNQEEIKLPDFVICRTIYPLLNKQFEYMGIPVFNNSHVAEICNDKAKTYQYVAQLDIPIVNSSFYKNSMIKNAMDNVKETSVVKAIAGHGGSQVFLINPKNQNHNDNSDFKDYNNNSNSSDSGNFSNLSNTNIIDKEDEFYQNYCSSTIVKQENEVIFNKLENSDVVIQPLTGSRHQDLRVYVIGKTIIAAILRTAKEGFKSNFSLGGKVRLYELSKDEIKLIEKIINIFDFGMVGIDFIIGDNGELIFNEIEDVVGARMLYQCTNINLVNLYLEFIKSKIEI